MSRQSVIVIAIGVVVVGYFGFLLLPSDSGRAAVRDRQTLRSRKVKNDRSAAPRRETRIRTTASRLHGGLDGKGISQLAEKADFSGALEKVLETAQEKALSEAEREIIEKLRDLVGTNSGGGSLGRASCRELARLLKMAASQKFAGQIGLNTKRALFEAVQSVGTGSGSSEVAEALLDYLADADPEITQAALDRFLEAVSDFSLGDRERAQLVVAASMTMDKAEDLEWAFSQFPTMRHSVAVDAFNQVAQRGNDTAKSMLPEQISNYAGDEAITTPEQAQEWLKEYPDGEDDEAFYGGLKDDGGMGI